MAWNNRSNTTGTLGNKVSLYNGNNTFENYATSPASILKIKILESRAYVIECVTSYTKVYASKADYGVVYVRCAINDLFLQVRSMIKKDYMDKEDKENLYTILLKKKDSNKFSDLIEAFELIDDYLLQKKITRIDYVENFDRTLVTEEDERNGL
jgi:hypothetical protein